MPAIQFQFLHPKCVYLSLSRPITHMKEKVIALLLRRQVSSAFLHQAMKLNFHPAISSSTRQIPRAAEKSDAAIIPLSQPGNNTEDSVPLCRRALAQPERERECYQSPPNTPPSPPPHSYVKMAGAWSIKRAELIFLCPIYKAVYACVWALHPHSSLPP